MEARHRGHRQPHQAGRRGARNQQRQRGWGNTARDRRQSDPDETSAGSQQQSGARRERQHVPRGRRARAAIEQRTDQQEQRDAARDHHQRRNLTTEVRACGTKINSGYRGFGERLPRRRPQQKRAGTKTLAGAFPARPQGHGRDWRRQLVVRRPDGRAGPAAREHMLRCDGTDPPSVRRNDRFNVNEAQPDRGLRQEERGRSADSFRRNIRRASDPRLRVAVLVVERDRQVVGGIDLRLLALDQIEQRARAVGGRKRARGLGTGRNLASHARQRRGQARKLLRDVGFHTGECRGIRRAETPKLVGTPGQAQQRSRGQTCGEQPPPADCTFDANYRGHFKAGYRKGKMELSMPQPPGLKVRSNAGRSLPPRTGRSSPCSSSPNGR